MDIHKPKPWHGLREFLKEYLIIVVGVLTALGAEQLVEWLHWRHQAEVAREAIAFDLRRLLGEAARKDASSPCMSARLGEISSALDRAQATGRLPPFGNPGNPLSPAWTFRSWSGLISGQTLAHIPNRDQLALAAIANYVEYLRPQMIEERDEWAVLTTMSGPGRPASDAEIANLRAALGRTAMAAMNQRGIGRGLESYIVRSGFLTRPQIDAAFQEGVASATNLPFCKSSATTQTFPDFVAHNLAGPPTRPGQQSLVEVGVGGALTTER